MKLKNNYLGACVPVPSEMYIHIWESLLEGYWDKQLLECLKFGFPLGFNRTCPLKHDKENHKSAVEFPEHVSKYIEEQKKNWGDYRPICKISHQKSSLLPIHDTKQAKFG